MSDLPAADLVYVSLHVGRDAAVTLSDIAERLNLSRRAVEAAVEALRRGGTPVCSGSEGIWLTDSPDELIDQYRRLRRRALTQLRNLRAMQRTAARMRGFEQLRWIA